MSLKKYQKKILDSFVSYKGNELDISKLRWAQQLSFIFFTQFLFFLLLKTYAGLIRHSSSIDAIKLLFSITGTLVVLLTVNFISKLVQEKIVFSAFNLLLNALVSFTLLFTFRLFVKSAYEYIKSVKFGRVITKAVIFGVSENAISIASAIDMDQVSNYEVIGFLSRKNSNRKLRVLNKPVISYNKAIKSVLKEQQIEAVIFPEGNFNSLKESNLIDQLLECNIKVLKTPKVTNWVEGKSISNTVQNIQIEDLLNRSHIGLNHEKIEEQLRAKTILVTGGAGSIGSEIVRQIAHFNPKLVIVLDQAETPLHNLSLELNEVFPNIAFQYCLADVRNKERIVTVFKTFSIDFVYHAAAYKHVPLVESNPSEAILSNVLGTRILADTSLKFGVKNFVMISTDKAVNPTNVMGASKRAAELYVQTLFFENSKNNNTTKFITTRFGNVLGSNGSVVPLFKEQIKKGGPITVTHPEITRYFMTISEACQLVLEAGNMGDGGEIFVFDMGESVKIKDLAYKMIRLFGLEPDIDIKIEYTGLRPGEKLYEELLNDESIVKPTYNKKIMIASNLEQNHKEIEKQVIEIIESALSNNDIDVVRKLKKMITTFKSNNSRYEELDTQTI